MYDVNLLCSKVFVTANVFSTYPMATIVHDFMIVTVSHSEAFAA